MFKLFESWRSGSSRTSGCSISPTLQLRDAGRSGQLHSGSSSFATVLDVRIKFESIQQSALVLAFDQFEAIVRSFGQSTIQDLATDAAAGATLQEYLEVRWIKTPATLAMHAKTEEDAHPTPVHRMVKG